MPHDNLRRQSVLAGRDFRGEEALGQPRRPAAFGSLRAENRGFSLNGRKGEDHHKIKVMFLGEFLVL